MNSLKVRGLRTEEDEKFLVFFKIVQETAEKEGKVFFLNVGEGNEIKTDELEGEDLYGWLIPTELADQFEKEWMKRSVGEEWEQFEVFEEWTKTENGLEIKFEPAIEYD